MNEMTFHLLNQLIDVLVPLGICVVLPVLVVF